MPNYFVALIVPKNNFPKLKFNDFENINDNYQQENLLFRSKSD